MTDRPSLLRAKVRQLHQLSLRGIGASNSRYSRSYAVFQITSEIEFLGCVCVCVCVRVSVLCVCAGSVNHVNCIGHYPLSSFLGRSESIRIQQGGGETRLSSELSDCTRYKNVKI